MTRKEKEELIETKLQDTDICFEEIEKHLNSLQTLVDKKASEDLIAEIRYEKVSKADFVDHLPEYLSPEALDNRIKDICDAGLARMSIEF